jgi:hypothetical protein
MTKTINKQRFITIDGVDVTVTEEVYRAYKRPAWAERKRRQVRRKKERKKERKNYHSKCLWIVVLT